jgi:predicted nucleic-acid-binding Zn-ribbon protein
MDLSEGNGMSELQPTQCPKCGSRKRDYGELVSFGETRFRSIGFLHWGRPVVAIACLHCGNIELVLEEVPIARAESDESAQAEVEHPSLRSPSDGIQE